MPRRRPRSSSIHTDGTSVPDSESSIRTDGISVPDPGNPRILLTLVGTWSEHDPSWEEARWRYYLDTGCVSLSTGPWAPSTVGDGESATSSSTCSHCAARLATSGKRDDETQGHGGTTDSAGTETRSISRRRRFENERGVGERRSRSSKTDHRFRRLEKTVESLSHGLILALTQLKSGDMHADTEPHRRGSGPGPPHRPGHSDVANDEIESVSRDHSVDDDDDDGCDLSTAFSGLGFTENSRGGIGTAAPSVQQLDNKSSPSLEENLLRMLRRLPQTMTTTSVSSKAGPENAFSCITTGNDGTLFTTGKDRSPAPQILSPILKYITSSDVFQFLKRAEIHAGLLKTQLFDLFWILDNLFNVHGGILIYCLLESLNTMDGISRSLGLDEWSHDPEFLRKLDGAYRKDLRLYIQAEGSTNASAAWKSYCFELAQIFSERFSSWRSVGYFRELSEGDTGCFNPVITASYIEDLVKQWTAVRLALLEVTRWFEPFIDYGPDCNRSAPFCDATIVLGRRARELLSRKGVKEPEISRRADCLLQRLRELRFDQLQLEMARVMDDVSRDFDAATVADDGDGEGNSSSDFGSGTGSGPSSATAEEAALLERMKRVTGVWPVITATESLGDQSAGDAGCGSSDRLSDALALHEIRVMKSYRPRLLHEGLSAAAIRCEIVRILSPEADGRNGRGCDITAEDIFWDGIV